MKKIALIASAALLSSAAMADAPAATGFYAGVNAGLANTNVKYSYVDGNTARLGTKLGNNGQQYGLFGGYNTTLGGNFVVGAELFVGGDNTKVTTTDTPGATNAGKTEVKRTMYYGVAPRVGVMLTPNVLAYVRLGVEGGKWKADYNPAGGQLVAAGTTIARKTDTKNSMNFAPGAGFDMFVGKNVFARAQYHHVFGPKITGKQVVANPDGTVVQDYKVSQSVVSLGFGYKF